MDRPQPSKLFLPALFFDEKCMFCARFAEGLRKIAGEEAICVISLYDEEVVKRFPDLTTEKLLTTLHLVTEDERVLKGSEALEHLMSLFPATKKIAWLMESDVAKKGLDFFYETANKLLHKHNQESHECKGCPHKSSGKK